MLRDQAGNLLVVFYMVDGSRFSPGADTRIGKVQNHGSIQITDGSPAVAS